MDFGCILGNGCSVLLHGSYLFRLVGASGWRHQTHWRNRRLRVVDRHGIVLHDWNVSLLSLCVQTQSSSAAAALWRTSRHVVVLLRHHSYCPSLRYLCVLLPNGAIWVCVGLGIDCEHRHGDGALCVWSLHSRCDSFLHSLTPSLLVSLFHTLFLCDVAWFMFFVFVFSHHFISWHLSFIATWAPNIFLMSTLTKRSCCGRLLSLDQCPS